MYIYMFICMFPYICHRPPAAGSPPPCRWTGPADRPAPLLYYSSGGFRV